MGCGDSRFRDRGDNIDDLNAVHIAYLGGQDFNWMKDAQEAASDQLALAQTGGSDPTSVYKYTGRTFKLAREHHR